MKNRFNLSDLCTISSSKRILKSEYVEKGIPFYRSKEIIEISNGKKISEPFFISNERFHQLKETFGAPNKGDILITSVGTLGVSLLVDLDYEFYFKDGNLTWLKNFNDEIINRHYLIHWLKSSFFFNQINNNNIGAVQKAITISFLNSVKIDLPDLSTQKQIAKVLSDLDAKIEVNNKINQALEAMAKTLYDYWFVQFDFPDENGKPYKSSGGKMVYNAILKREIPEGWEDTVLEQLCIKIGDGLHGTPVYVDDSDFSFINGNNLKNGFISIDSATKKISKKEYKNHFIELNENSILLSINGTLGNIAVFNGEKVMLGKSSAYINCKQNYGSYCYQYLGQSHMKRVFWNMATGSTIKNLGLTSIKKLKIIKPSLTVLKSFEAFTKPITQKRKNLSNENQKLSALRDWLLPMLMNGQVTVGGLEEVIENKIINVDFQEKECSNSERAILAAYIIKYTGNVNLGRTKLMKLLHLTEYHCRIDLKSHFIKKTAGPYDKMMIHDIETYFRRYKLYKVKQDKLDNNKVSYTLSSGSNDINRLFRNNFNNQIIRVNFLLDKFKEWSYKECEIISTLYAVWNNRIISNQIITDDLIKHDFLNWDSHKLEYKDRLDNALSWMRKENIIPTGWGDYIDFE